MTFSLSIFLIPYGLFLVVWFFLSAVGYYHLLRFGGRRFSTYLLGIVYFLGCVVLLQVTYLYFQGLHWGEIISAFPDALPIRFGEINY